MFGIGLPAPRGAAGGLCGLLVCAAAVCAVRASLKMSRRFILESSTSYFTTASGLHRKWPMLAIAGRRRTLVTMWPLRTARTSVLSCWLVFPQPAREVRLYQNENKAAGGVGGDDVRRTHKILFARNPRRASASP